MTEHIGHLNATCKHLLINAHAHRSDVGSKCGHVRYWLSKDEPASAIHAASANDSGLGNRAEGAPSRSAEGAPSMAMSADRRECAEVNKALSKKHAQRYARSDMSTSLSETGGEIQL